MEEGKLEETLKILNNWLDLIGENKEPEYIKSNADNANNQSIDLNEER